MLAKEYTTKDSIRYMHTDTFFVHEVAVVSAVSGKYQAGIKQLEITETQLNTIGGGNLTDLLSRYTPVYVKSDAGSLSTIRIRGTSPDHTSIFFGGLNINSLTLGHSNAANIPINIFDNVSIQLGSSSAETGSGAIGGSIRLGTRNNWTEGYKIALYGEAGSFGRNNELAKIYVGNGKWESVSRFRHFGVKNNFPFYNLTMHDFESDNGYQKDVQRFAAVKNIDVVQELKYRFSKQEWVEGKVWFADAWRQAQPTMGSNSSESLTPQDYRDKSVRIWTNYTNQKGPIQFQVGAGGVMDNSVNMQVDSQSIITKRFVTEAQMEQKIGENAGYKAGLKYKFIRPEVYTYKSGYTEEHLDLFASFYKQFFKRLKLALNLRQQFVTAFKAPFTPSLGVDYLLLNQSHDYLKLLGNVSKSYRIPTFNDRFWIPGGNPDLKPENGNNFELGTKYAYCGSSLAFNVAAQYFYHDVENWLQWKQGNNGWEASNELHVISKGVEFATDATFYINQKTTLKSGLNYTYNQAIRVESESQSDKLNSQLEYVPEHIGNVWVEAQIKSASVVLDGSYTGERSYNQIGGTLDPYALVNATAFYNLILQKHAFRFSASIQNVFDTSYQNQYLYAMPGRWFKVGVNYQITN